MERFLAVGCAVLLALTGLCQPARSAPLPQAASPQANAKSSSTSHKKTTRHKVHHRRSHSRRRVSRRHGQQKIDASRTRDIQEALIRQHYMNGEPTGKWDEATQSALRRYQGDNGWQTKVVPDSRALIKLGLGPDQEHLLNPETAMTSVPVKQAGDADDATTKPAAKAAGDAAAAASDPSHTSSAPVSKTSTGSTSAGSSATPPAAQPSSVGEDASPQK